MARGAADGHVIIDTALNNKGFVKGLGLMKKQVGGLQSAVSKLGATIATVFAVKAIVDFGKKAVEVGSNIAEVQNVVDVSFGELAYKAEEFASTAITQFGMSTLAAKKTASTYMAMAKGMGVASDEASDMAITLAGLSGDVASFFNISQELADIKLKSVFTGETETLKDLGVVMTQDNLKAYALSKGITKSYDAMGQAEKVALRYHFVLDSLALANGDFARTQDSWANQTRILSMQWQEFMGILGQSIIRVLKPVVVWLNTMVSRMITLAEAFNRATEGMDTKGQQAEQAEATSSAIAASVKGQEDLTDAVKDTTKAQQKSVAGFDEITQLAQDAADATGSMGAIGGLDAGAMSIPEVETPKLKEPEFKSWGEAFDGFLDVVIDKGIPRLRGGLESFTGWLNGFSGKVYDMLTFPGVADKMETVGDDLAGAANNMVLKIDWYKLGGALGAGLNLALLFLVSYVYGFDWLELGSSLATSINGAVAEIDWRAVGKYMFAGIKVALEMAAGFVLGLDMPQLATAASNMVISFFNAMTETVYGIDWGQVGVQIGTFLSNVDWFGIIDSVMVAIGNIVVEGIRMLGGIIAGSAPEILLAIGVLIAAVMLGVPAMLSGFPTIVVAAVVAVIAAIWAKKDEILDVFQKILAGIQETFAKIPDWFRNKFAEAWQAVKNVFSSGGKIFDGIKDGILSGLKAVVNALISGINRVIAVPFNGINSALRGIKGVNILGLKPFDWISEISVPQIPHLAKGAVIPPNREFMAVLGDQRNGNNIETPEDLLRKIYREEGGAANAEVLSILQAILEAIRDGKVLMVDKRQLGKVVQEALGQMARASGTAVLQL